MFSRKSRKHCDIGIKQSVPLSSVSYTLCQNKPPEVNGLTVSIMIGSGTPPSSMAKAIKPANDLYIPKRASYERSYFVDTFDLQTFIAIPLADAT